VITDFFTTAFTAYRLQWTPDGSGNLQSTEQLVTTFNGHIQQASAELIEHLGLSFTKSFTVWCLPTVNVKPGDTITDGTRSFSVRAVMANVIGAHAHFELVVELDEVEEEADES
jgi:hypothetical protein